MMIEVAKLVTTSSQFAVGDSKQGLNSYFLNFAGDYLKRQDIEGRKRQQKNTRFLPDAKVYATNFWGMKGGVGTGTVYKLYERDPDAAIDKFIEIIYDLYSKAGVEMRKKYPGITSTEFIQKIGLHDLIMTSYPSAGFAGSKLKGGFHYTTNDESGIHHKFMLYSVYFNLIANAIIAVADNLIQIELLRQESEPKSKLPHLAGYDRFKSVVIGAYLADDLRNKIASLMALERTKGLNYYLDRFIQLGDNARPGKPTYPIIKGEIIAVLTHKLNALHEFDEGRDKDRTAMMEMLDEYLGNNYAGIDLDDMRNSYIQQSKRYYKEPPQSSFTTRKFTGLDPWDQPKSQSGGGLSTPILTLFSLEIKSHGKEPEDFIEKAKATINDMGQLPLVKEYIGDLFDSVRQTHEETDGYTFAPFNGDLNQLAAIHDHFSESDLAILKKLSLPVVFYPAVPEDFEAVLGKGAYSLHGDPSPEENLTPLYGLDEEIDLTKEERATLEKGGIPLGALMFLYFVCLDESKTNA